MKLELRISDRIYFPSERFSVKELKIIKDSFIYNNPQFYKARNMGFSYFGLPSKIATWELSENGIMSIARGAHEKLFQIFKNLGVEYSIKNERYGPRLPENTFVYQKQNFKLRQNQIEAAKALIDNGGGLIKGVCGSGKTEILLLAILGFSRKSLVLVHTTDLMKQWIERIKLRFGFQDHQIGKIGGGFKKSIGNITVGTVQTMVKCSELWKGTFGLIALDEAHHAPATSFLNLIDKFDAMFRIGASATIRRKDGLEFLTYDEFGPVVYEITNQIMVDKKLLHDVEIVVIPTDFVYTGPIRDAKRLKLNSNGEKETISNKMVDWPIFLNQITKDLHRNNLIFKFLKSEVDAGNFCILLSERREHCFLWQKFLAGRGIEAGLLIGGTRHRKESSHSIKKMTEGKLQVVVCTRLADEGLDIPRLNRGFATCPSAGNKFRFEQQTGRLRRLFDGKSDAKFYYFWDHKVSKMDRHLKNIKNQFQKVTIIKR